MAPDLRKKVDANRAARLAQEQEMKRLMDAQAGYHSLMFRASHHPLLVHPSTYRLKHLSLRSLFGPILEIPERLKLNVFCGHRTHEGLGLGRSYSIHTALHVERLYFRCAQPIDQLTPTGFLRVLLLSWHSRQIQQLTGMTKLYVLCAVN